MGALAGPAGCSAGKGDEARDDSSDKGGAWLVGASTGWFRSHLRFDGGHRPDFNQGSVAATGVYLWPNGYSLGIAAGAALGGFAVEGDTRYTLEPGWMVSVRGGKLVVEERGAVPFVDLSLTLTFSMSSVSGGGLPTGRLIASDARFSAAIGYTFGGIWRVNISPKIFGGPIFWERDGENIRGSDRYFFQAGIASSVLLPGGWMIFVEGSPLGEQTISGGIAAVF